ncbi:MULTISPECIES: Mu-like prophage major head subunit gpT family protein [unclassified Acinetobacter]|uniref:Mu-like prophage major head subunit gpT family protein n=1 Tax=unclassified Acinetobacter TaxID=196816 RepID=UPI001909859C|nr:MULTISPECIES: Mu-like prophage major head subunit gpT family protein [unclassified Acinetobacter]MBK0062389.1 Mu-like prophage major head subunit gpT family protein [Acinetobacter sp. S55]MBK0066193.1 Mu-like prophage major head subunit gpT family protein [Acinetobacter sp. S54]
MNVNGTTIDAIFLSLSTAFNQTFAATPTEWQTIAMEIPSSGAYVDHRWLGAFPQMKEWIGKKNIKKLDEYEYVVKNKSYESTIEIKRDDIEDDQIGIYGIQAQNAGAAAKKHPDQLVYQAVNTVFTAKCFDGQPMVSNNHKVGKSTVSNKGTKKLSTATAAAADLSYGAGRQKMMEFEDESGESLGVIPNILLVPPALETVGKKLLTAEKLDDGSINPYVGTAKLVVSTRIKNPNYWMLLDTSKPVKPFIYQKRKAANLVKSTNPEAPNVFLEGVFYYGVEARGNAGFGFWQLIYASDGSQG